MVNVQKIGTLVFAPKRGRNGGKLLSGKVVDVAVAQGGQTVRLSPL